MPTIDNSSLRIHPIASGSSGNCTVIQSKDAQVILDAGISFKQFLESAEALSIDPNCTDGILVTHEHADHISSIHTFANRLKANLYMTKGTYYSIAPYLMSYRRKPEVKIIDSDESFKIRDLQINAIPSAHDAADPVNYAFSCNKTQTVHITDTGIPTPKMKSFLQRADFAIIESNHDEDMLTNGRYPHFLKKRIASDQGHLSNSQAACLVLEHVSDKMKGIMLGHLSEHNNTPDVAIETFTGLIRQRKDLNLDPKVLNRRKISMSASINKDLVNFSANDL